MDMVGLRRGLCEWAFRLRSREQDAEEMSGQRLRMSGKILVAIIDVE